MDDRGRGVIVRKSGGGALILFRRIEEGRYSFIPQQASVVTVACTQRDGEKASAAYSAGGNHKAEEIIRSADWLSAGITRALTHEGAAVRGHHRVCQVFRATNKGTA
ncbi:uncharacterized [Tachysurus ichikawai]